MRSALLVLAMGCAAAPAEDTSTPDAPWDNPWDPPETTDTDLPIDPGPSEVVLVGQLIGASTPVDPWIAEVVANGPFPPPAATLQFYVSRATDAADLEAGRVAGLRPMIHTVDGSGLSLEPSASDGAYQFRAGDGLAFTWGGGGSSAWEPGEVAGWAGAASVQQPASAVVAWPETHPLGAALILDFENQGFTSNVTVVLDASGAVTWSNDPAALDALFAANHDDDTSNVTIPAEAFGAPGDYVLGLAACTRTFPLDLTALDPELTAVRAGLMSWSKLTVE